MMVRETPTLDPRNRDDLFNDMMSHLPGYIINWTPSDGTPGMAILQIFSRYMNLLTKRANSLPLRSQLAFLQMLGISQLPAQAARAPLVFTLIENSLIDSPLLIGSRIASRGGQAEHLFAVEQGITIVRSRLVALYAIDPNADQIADYSAHMINGFTLFDDMQLIEHEIYLGHDRLFNLPQEADLILNFDLSISESSSIRQDIQIAWEYLSQSGWHTLPSPPIEGIVTNGQVMLSKRLGPDSKEDTIEGHTSYWIRGRLRNPLPPPHISGSASVPAIDRVQARVSLGRSGIRPDNAFSDRIRIDVNDLFYPFGKQPTLHSTFYLGSKEVFQNKGARIRLHILFKRLIQPVSIDPALQPALAWEYYNGREWVSLQELFIFNDGTHNFTKESFEEVDNEIKVMERVVSFLCPDDWTATSVNGISNYWLRVRIVNNDYGGPIVWEINSNSVLPKSGTQPNPPLITKLTLSYTYLTDPELLDHCLVINNHRIEDMTQASRWPRQTFVPFQPVTDQQAALYFGFDQPFSIGLISLYINISTDSAQGLLTAGKSPYIWEYYSPDGWVELNVDDHTDGFRFSGVIQFIAPNNFTPLPGLGGNLYRLRARLKPGARIRSASINGVWLNAVWATKREQFERSPLGISDGNPRQTFSFPIQSLPILEGEQIEVLEWQGRGSGWEVATEGAAEEDIRRELDPATQAVQAVWVRWHQRPTLYASSHMDRHYTLDHATGLLRFGDGQYGMIPPAGAQIITSNYSGGGVSGNVAASTISQMRSAVPYIQQVNNPIPAAGGAETENIDMTRKRGSQRIRHLGRAISTADFEWLAREASPDVAQSHCLSITGPEGYAQRGWVTLVIVPYSEALQPQPSLELCRRVQEYVAARAPATAARRIRVLGPTYLLISLITEIIPRVPDEAAKVEQTVEAAINRFLHPLVGGREGQGWAFGEGVFLSQMAALIEAIEGVDYARHIELQVNGHVFHQFVPGRSDALIAPGKHEIRLSLAEED